MNKSTIKISIISILLTFPQLLSSCWIDEHADGTPVQAYRTVLFYLAGDGDASGEVQSRLDALQEIWNNDIALGGRLLVYIGASTDTPARLMEMVADDLDGGKVTLHELRTYEDANSASSEGLSRVINDMYTLYPSQDYGMVLFSQGSGWLPAEHLEVPRRRSAGADSRSNPQANTRSVIGEESNFLELRDFALAIPNGQFSFIVLESGYMAGIEVAYELKEKTDYLIATSTEIPSPGFLPVYEAMLPELFKAYPFYRKAAQAYFDFYNRSSGDFRSATISVIRTSKLEPLKRMLNAAESRVGDWEELNRGSLQAFDRREDNHLFYDLGDYFRLIGNDEERAAFADSLSLAVVYEAATEAFLPQSGGFDITSHSGLTIYIPDVHYPILNGQRRSLRLFQ